MFFIDMEKKIEFPGGHIEIMVFIESAKLELTGGHIRIMLFIEIENLEFAGGHIGIMLFIEIDKGESNSNIYISINRVKTIWSPENRIFNSLPFCVCWLSYI